MLIKFGWLRKSKNHFIEVLKNKKIENRKEVLKSKIVPYLHKNAAVTTSRNDVDYAVTEYGVAWLRGLNIKRRVEELIKIAHPNFREELKEEAEKLQIW